MKVGKRTYLYESVSFRDEQGRPRNKKTYIGKIDLNTDQPVYKLEYIERMQRKGTPVAVPVKFSAEDVQSSTIKEYGAYYLLNTIAQKSGLNKVLSGIFPEQWEQILTLAQYLVCMDDPVMYCEDWLTKTESLPVGTMSSQRISELLSSISHEDRISFYEEWGNYRKEREYLALDITSVSSYSELIESVEWGYNRDGEDLAQINLCMLYGEQSGLPVYSVVYSGSLKDVSTLRATIKQIEHIREEDLMLVMDKGYCSKANIDMMLEVSSKVKFVIAMPFTHDFAKEQVTKARQEIDQFQNTIDLGNDTVFGRTRECMWDEQHKVYSHVFYNAIKATQAKNDLYTHVKGLEREARGAPEKSRGKGKFVKYLNIRKSGKAEGGYSIKVKEAELEKRLKNVGWLVMVSNHITEASEAIRIYRKKDVVEKAFERIKCNLGLGRLRIHSETNMQNKVFMGFIALILMSYIHNIMSEKDLYKYMTMKRLIKALENLKVQRINGHRILFPLTKTQKMIFDAFDVHLPV
jgi:transposase